MGNPSKRVNKNPHATPHCQGCIYEDIDDPTERPCFLCNRKEFSIDADLATRELMAHYKEYFEENKRMYHDYYIEKSGKKRTIRRKKDWLKLGS